MLYATFYLAFTAFILFFITDYTIMMIGVFIFGTGEGGFWVMMSPIFANVIDESVAETGQRREGVYNGIQTFFSRAAFVIQAISIGGVHIITGYDPGDVTELAKFGIQIHFALIPSILMFIGAIVFTLYFKLSPEVVDRNRERLAQLKI
jgi:GPH family glycoside/pentoside/hexuronide:cation symporter